jgi:hypothetical protein
MATLPPVFSCTSCAGAGRVTGAQKMQMIGRHFRLWHFSDMAFELNDVHSQEPSRNYLLVPSILHFDLNR